LLILSALPVYNLLINVKLSGFIMDTSTASIKVARDYFKSSQNTILIPNRDFGKKKFIHVGINKSNSSRFLNRGTSEEPETVPPNLTTQGSTYGGYSSSLGMRAG